MVLEFAGINNALYENIAVALLAIFVTYLVIKVLNFGIEKLTFRLAKARRIRISEKKARHYSKPLKLLVNTVSVIILAMVILRIFGLQTSFLATLSAAGFLGIVVGFAAKDVLGNLMAGIIIFTDKPFLIGDWIVVDDVEGKVEDMHVASTRIRTWDGELLVIPNAMLTNSKIINKTMQGNLRLKIPFGVDYDSDLTKVAKVTLSLAKKTPGIMESPEPMVIVKEFGESSINMELRVWLHPEKDSTVAVKNSLLLGIKQEFQKNKIKIPYPHVELVK